MKFLRVKNLNMWLLLVVMASGSRLYTAEQSEVVGNQKNSFKPIGMCQGWQPRDKTHELDGKQPIIEWKHECEQNGDAENQEFRIVRSDGDIVFSGVKDAQSARLVASKAVCEFLSPLRGNCRNLNAQELNDLFQQERLSPVKVLPDPMVSCQPPFKKPAIGDVFSNISLSTRRSINSFKK